MTNGPWRHDPIHITYARASKYKHRPGNFNVLAAHDRVSRPEHVAAAAVDENSKEYIC